MFLCYMKGADHNPTHSSNSKGYDTLFGPLRDQVCICCICIHEDKTLIQIN